MNDKTKKIAKIFAALLPTVIVVLKKIFYNTPGKIK